MWWMFAWGLLTGLIIGAGGFFIWCWVILRRDAMREAKRQMKLKFQKSR